jgi:hypothetical protein
VLLYKREGGMGFVVKTHNAALVICETMALKKTGNMYQWFGMGAELGLQVTYIDAGVR